MAVIDNVKQNMEDFKQRYYERYARAKAKGEKFFPDVIYQDTLIMLGIFIVLLMLTIFMGVANEPKADPSDSAYIPRPEWYFLFLFQMLKLFPGRLEWVGTFLVPAIVVLVLLVLPFIDRNPYRYFGKRKIAIAVMLAMVAGIVALTVWAQVTTPPQEETGTLYSTIGEKVAAGQDLYSINCVECHGPEGKGGEVIGVKGMEGKILKPINSQDEMYTRDDLTLSTVISYGQPDQGMTPFSKAYGGQLSVSDIDAIVAFMRYTWDDRAQLPKNAVVANTIPDLKEGEVPSYEVHIAPIVKRNCLSCHRTGRESQSQNYLMDTYDNVMNSGDHKPNVVPGDLNSHLFLMINRQEIEAGKAMPPTSPLSDKYIEYFKRWIEGGAPNTKDDAAKAVPGGGAAPAATTAPGAPAATPAPAATETPAATTTP